MAVSVYLSAAIFQADYELIMKPSVRLISTLLFLSLSLFSLSAI